MTVDESRYSINQVQEMINEVIQNEMAAWSHQFADENQNPNIPPTLPPPQQSANSLTDNDLVKLSTFPQNNNTNRMDMAKILQLLKNDDTKKPKVYTESVHGCDAKGKAIT